MDVPMGLLTYLLCFIFFLPVFAFLFVLGMVKAAIFSPFVFLVIAFGDTGIVCVLLPCHLVWTCYCIARSEKFGPYMKCLLILTMPIPILLWAVVGVAGSVVMGVGYAYVWPVMETFRAISKEGVSFHMKLLKCFTDGTWSNVWGACTIVRDFADFAFHSYFSVMDGLLESKGEEPIELKVSQIPGCILAGFLGVLFDVPVIVLIVIYKTPILLFKGWQRLLEDLIGRSGPFLETVCVPFAGLLILLWPFGVILAALVGIFSTIGYGCYAATVAYQENSTKKGILYVFAAPSLFDEYTNDLLYLREGSCFPRPKYREHVGSSSLIPLKGLQDLDSGDANQPLIRTSSEKTKALKSVVIWDSFFKSCKDTGKELLRAGAIDISDLEEWQQSKNKIVDIGIPAYAFLECFLHSIKSGSPGLLIRDNVEVTTLNRPEGRIFDWLYEPMLIMKDQIRSLNLLETEELYLFKLALYCEDTKRVDAWENGGCPPNDEIRKAQLEGISRRLHGFCLTVSRLPTSRRRFSVVVKALEKEEKWHSIGSGSGDIEAALLDRM